MRIILFAGKGGVGKTSVAAATGIKAAEMDQRTVILSLDVAHSLGDIFDLERSLLDQNNGKPIEVNKNLWIQELNIQEEMTRHFGEIHNYFSAVLNSAGLNEVLAEELAILPGMEEISLLLYINHYVQERKFDLIILDCAPTGESLRFISLPTTLEWYMGKIFKMERAISRYVRPVVKRVSDIPMPGDDYFKAIEYLFERLRGVDQILVDPQITTVRLITNPEKVVLRETQRAFMYFCLYKMNIDAIIMNRILPLDLEDTYLQDSRKSQKQNIEKAKECFSPVPIFPVKLFKDEVLGYDRLKALAEQIYGDRNPVKRFFTEEPYSFIKNNGAYSLRMKVPFIVKGDVRLGKLSDELVVRVGNLKRHVLLPRQVAALEPVRAKLEGDYLSVIFRRDGGGK